MFYTEHVSLATLISRAFYFLVTLLLLTFLNMMTASKDCLIFEKQPVLIVRRIKVSIKDKSILCKKQCKNEFKIYTKTIS